MHKLYAYIHVTGFEKTRLSHTLTFAYTYVTGLVKTDRIVTITEIHFIA